jgi:hypothetical protein
MMAQIISSWQDVLTKYVNQTYGKSYDVADLQFKHNIFYTPIPGRKVIDAFAANDKNIHRGLCNIIPFDPVKFFQNVPVIVYSDDDATGSEIIDLLQDAYGIQFDKTLDFDAAFLARKYQIDSTVRTVTVTFAATSMIWEGDLSFITVSRGNDINKAVVNRDLDALVIPDITVAGTQSLQLITKPLVVINPTLVRKFSGSDPVVLEDSTLTLLIDELLSQRIVDASDAGELTDLFRGRTVVGYDTGETPYDRYVAPESALQGGKWSGIPRFKFKSVVIDTDISSIVGEIVVNDFPEPATVKMASFFVAAGHYQSYITNLLLAQMQLYPEKAEGIQELIGKDLSTVFSGVTRDVTGADIDNGKASVYLETVPGGEYSGRLKVTFPLPDFAIQDEAGIAIASEQGGSFLEMEERYIVVLTGDGSLQPGDFGTPISSASLAEASMLALMLYQNDDSLMAVLKPTVVDTVLGNGHAYTEPDWPGVEVRTIPHG